MTGESRLGRWSRLKTKNREDKQKTYIAHDIVQDRSAEASELAKIEVGTDDTVPNQAELNDEDVDLDALAAEHDLPKVEDLEETSDFKAFLQPNVPDLLKRAALRKLWLSDPVFAHLDGLNEYDEDYNIIDKVLESVSENSDIMRRIMGKEDAVAESEKPEEPAVSQNEQPKQELSEETNGQDQENKDEEEREPKVAERDSSNESYDT